MHTPARDHADQPRNSNYKKDIVYVTKHLKWILNCIGIWPAMLKGIGKFLPRIAIVLCNLVLFFIEVQCVLHIILEQKDPLLRLRLLGLACYSLICLMKYWALTVRKSKIKYCIEQLHTDWKEVSRSEYIFEGPSGKVTRIINCKGCTFVKKQRGKFARDFTQVTRKFTQLAFSIYTSE